MHIPKDHSNLAKLRTKIGVVIVLLLVATLSAFTWQSLIASTKKEQPVFTEVVRSGSLEQKVSAYGSLKPMRITSLISQVDGRIREVKVRPGAYLKKGQAILELVNPRLQRRQEEAELSLLEKQAEIEQLNQQMADELLQAKSEYRLSSLQRELVMAEMAAKQKLLEKSIISALDFKKAELEVEQVALRCQMAEEKLATLERSQLAQLKAAGFALDRVRKQYEMVKQDVSDLVIRAGMDGILNEMQEWIQPGANIDAGQALGNISDPSSLYAEIRISAADAPAVSIGNEVRLNIKGRELFGIVNRIAPNVEENQVKLDVELQGSLPDTARPNIELNAVVITSAYQAGLLARRPEHIRAPHQSYDLYVFMPDKNKFVLTKIQVGEISDKEMQILSGLHQGDNFLLSVPVRFNGQQSISKEDLNV